MLQANELPFHFDVDVDVFQKAGNEATERRIGGFVHTEDVDQQGETLLAEGLDFTHFLTKGWFNDNHSRDTTGIVGYPEIAEVRTKGGKKGWYVEGHLIKGSKRADEIWELANALQKSKRRLGFSVEGKILERTGDNRKTIAKAIVKNVAITNCPVNDKTDLQVLAKSLDAFEKALAMGAPIAGGPTGAGPQTGEGAGQVVAPESLDGDLSSAQDRKKKKKKKKLQASPNGGLSKSAGVDFLIRKNPQLSRATAARIWDFAQRIKTAR